MSPTRLKAVAAVLMVSLTLAGLAILDAVRSRASRAAGPVLVSILSPRGDRSPDFLVNYTVVNIVPEIRRVPGVAITDDLAWREYEMQIRLEPDRMRDNHLSIDDIQRSIQGCTIIGSSGRFVVQTVQTDEYKLTHVGRYARADEYENLILRANPEGEILRLRDVGRVESVTSLADLATEIDGHPAAACVLEATPGTGAAAFVAAVTDRLRSLKAESFPPGMDFQVTPLDHGTVIGADLRLPESATLDATVARCHELADQARRVDGVASVIVMAGYDLRTERRSLNRATCLIRTKLGGSPGLATFRERCPVAGADVAFFEPPGVRVFGSAMGFAVRVLDQTHAAIPETFLRDLSAPGDRDGLLPFLAENFPKYELILDADVARRHGISLPKALAARFQVVGSADPADRTPRRLVEDFAHPNYPTDPGEMVPYERFLQLRLKPDSDVINRL